MPASAPHLRLVHAAPAPQRAGALFSARRTARPALAGRKPLGQILLDMKAVDPGNLLKAIALRDREDVRLGDILLTRGWVSEADLTAALSIQWQARAVDLIADPPDARLIDRMGAELCLAHGFIPWRRVGGATVIATSRPEEFQRRPAGLGRVVMAIAPERDVHAALIALRQTTLARKAEERVAPDESCRSLDGARAARRILSILGALALGLVLLPSLTVGAVVIWAVLTLLAFTALKLAALATMLRPAPPRQSPLPARLPTVSVMVPLYREDDIAPRLIRRIGRIDYPKELLDILLVVEEDDLATQAALGRRTLPRWMRIVIVPRGTIRTKPRALNYALDFCRGSIVGIWDAEDAPDPGQILAVVRRFAAAPAEVVCLQGILDFYNARHNWITRCFAIEYAAWFRVLLPGLARLGLVVPLGGTTLFFRRKAIEELGGWDAHNVTEDADLGLRLARHGYRTELIDTVTGEEPNARALSWIRQRSRWQKGFAMTWASHMRDPGRLWRDLGPWRFLGVQIMLLGTLSQAALAPVLWTFWLFAFGLPHPLGGILADGVVLALTALFLAAEGVNVIVGLWATRGAGHRHLMKWVPSLHVYNVLASISAWKALQECVTRPFYWDKTAHGLIGVQADAAPLLPVLILTDPVSLPPPPAAPVPLRRPGLAGAKARMHLRLPAGFIPPPPEPVALPRKGRPVLTLVRPAPRAPYILGSAIAEASGRGGVEFQPRFEGF